MSPLTEQRLRLRQCWRGYWPTPDEQREAQESEVTITEEKMHRECYDQLKEFNGF